MTQRRWVDRIGVEQAAAAERGVVGVARKLCVVVKEVVQQARVRAGEDGRGVEVADRDRRPGERGQIGRYAAARGHRADHARPLASAGDAPENEKLPSEPTATFVAIVEDADGPVGVGPNVQIRSTFPGVPSLVVVPVTVI